MKKEPPEPQVWRYELGGGWVALAGKTDEDNDRLSLKTARANDLWFHVHGLPGSHIILQGPDGEEAPADLIKQAASIAVRHSKARNGGTVPVSCTQAKNVSKPRGAKPGTVSIKRERKIKISSAFTAFND
jgi:predicted ribosome quality control (RQC) complex YloA/Tae2 family protein